MRTAPSWRLKIDITFVACYVDKRSHLLEHITGINTLQYGTQFLSRNSVLLFASVESRSLSVQERLGSSCIYPSGKRTCVRTRISPLTGFSDASHSWSSVCDYIIFFLRVRGGHFA